MKKHREARESSRSSEEFKFLRSMIDLLSTQEPPDAAVLVKVSRELLKFAAIKTNESKVNSIHTVRILQLISSHPYLYVDDTAIYREILDKLAIKLQMLGENCIYRQQTSLFYKVQNYKHPHYGLKEIIIWLDAVSKIPACSLNNVACIKKMLKVIPHIHARQPIMPTDLCVFLGALAKIVYATRREQSKSELAFIGWVENYLATSLASFSVVSTANQGCLWRWLSYVQVRGFDLKDETKQYYQQLELSLSAEPSTAQISSPQEEITKEIASLLSDQVDYTMDIEKNIGNYSLDIAVSTDRQNFNIEIDGSVHYWQQKLRQPDQIRDYILFQLKNYYVLRLKISDYQACDNKIEFLQEKLQPIFAIVKQSDLSL